MAEWGKGDPRWIVDQREDGKNVNAWHWEEKDCTKWTRDRLTALVAQEPPLVEGANEIRLLDVTELDGEVNWYNRKGKLFTLYDLKVQLSFSGKAGEAELGGKIKIEDFEQDNENKATFRANVTKGTGDNAWKAWAVAAVKRRFLELWAKLILELHEDQKSKVPALTASETSGKLKLPEMVQQHTPVTAPAPVAAPGTISLNIVFQASVQDIWDLFTNEQKSIYFSQSKAAIDAKEGGSFALYEGTITGCFLDLKPNTDMRLAWRLKDWGPGVNSQVAIKFVKSKDGTRMELRQTNVPAQDVERTREGWKRYYFERWRGVFGFSYELQ